LGTLPLAEVVAVAHARGVPVIVDAAEQVPPAANLWHYTRDLGCDLAVFSGGKGICGPQTSGLVVGRAELVEACADNGFPHTRFGRAMKVGKEEIAGLLAALELCLAADRPARIRAWNAVVADWAGHLGQSEMVTARTVFPSWSPEVARLLVEVRPAAGFSVHDLRGRMLDGDPPVAVEIPPNTDRIYVNPECLEPGEEGMVLAALSAAVAELAK
jgi:L-seryl-tRNA(Ser) seleniumtransferase